MVTGVKFRRGTSAEHASFTGQQGEITVNTTKTTAVVHDGTTVGGFELINVSAGQTLSNKTFSGVSTFVGIVASTLNVSGVITATSFSGSGANLTGIIAGVGIQTSAGLVGTGATILDFRGSGISTITVASGIATINIQGGTSSTAQFSRTITTFTATANQTTFSVAYTVGYVDVYLNGARLSSSEYTASNGTSVVLASGATLNDVIDIISYGGTGTALWNVGTGSSIYSLSYVGIGTTNPTTTLQVTGNTLITGVTTITGNLNAAGNYYVKLARTTNQTITSNVDTLIGFTATSDTNGWYSGITTRTTPTVAGTYRVDAIMNWQAGTITNNQTNIQIRKNGTTFALHQVGIATFAYSQTACGIVTMNGTTDYIDFTVYSGNTTSQVVTGTADGAWTKMEIFKIN